MTSYDPDPKNDSWHKFKGVAPAKRTSHGVTEDKLDEFVRQNKHECDWQQRGNERFCEAGGFRHGYYVDPKLTPKYREKTPLQEAR